MDAHAHSDLVPLMARAQPFKLLQGVTTEVNGNCGFSYAPDASALEELTGEDVPDWTFALHGGGWLGPSSWADVCVFDPETIGHAGTYADPSVRPSGIAYVLLEGRVVVESGEFTGERRGRVLRAGQ